MSGNYMPIHSSFTANLFQNLALQLAGIIAGNKPDRKSFNLYGCNMRMRLWELFLFGRFSDLIIPSFFRVTVDVSFTVGILICLCHGCKV